jgi:hypothetical protein
VLEGQGVRGPKPLDVLAAASLAPDGLLAKLAVHRRRMR